MLLQIRPPVAGGLCSGQSARACQAASTGRADALQLERIEQSGKELADLGEGGGQRFMERIHGTRYYG